MGFVWRQAGSIFHKVPLTGARGRLRSHREPRWTLRRLAAKSDHRATNRSRKKVLQQAGSAQLPDLRQLVGGAPRTRGWRAVFEENGWLDVRGSGRDVVVGHRQGNTIYGDSGN